MRTGLFEGLQPPLWRRIVPALAAAGLLLAAAGCGNKVSDRDISYVTVEEAIDIGAGSAGVLGVGATRAVWVDPRSAARYRESHIPGAINISLEDVKPDHPALREYDTFIVYGDDYNAPIAAAMCKRLLATGYADVRSLRGGLRAWERGGNEVTRE